MPNPNNYIELNISQFIEIIEGKNDNFSRPQRANTRSSLDLSNKALLASGEIPKCYIYLPTFDLRQEEYRNHMAYLSGYTAENRPDPKEPLIYRVTGPVLWNRGLNESTGEGVKDELACDINLLRCEFASVFIVNNVKSRASIELISSTFKNKEESQFSFLKSTFKKIIIIDHDKNDSKEKSSIKKIVINDVTTEELVISNMTIDELFIQGKEGLIKNLSIVNCIISTLIIGDTEVEEISIANTAVSGGFTLSANLKKFYFTGKELHADNMQHVNRLNLSQSDLASKSEYFIKDSLFAHLIIGGTIDGKLLLTESEINDLIFDEFLMWVR